jgi:hypothetical protein
MSDSLIQIRDQDNGIVLGLCGTSYVDHWVTAGPSTVSWDWPDGYSICRFGTTGIFYVKQGASAAVPVADVNDGTGSLKSPAFIKKSSDSFFGIAVSAATTVTMEFYK